MQKKRLISQPELHIILKRLALEIIENHHELERTAIIGLQPRGVFAARIIIDYLREFLGPNPIQYGELDHTFHRDDFRTGDTLRIPHPIKIDFDIENKNIILIDDVVYTGRSVKSAMDALSSYGRPAKIELLAVIDRRFNRETPIMSDYCGKVVDTRSKDQKVQIDWDLPETHVWLLKPNHE